MPVMEPKRLPGLKPGWPRTGPDVPKSGQCQEPPRRLVLRSVHMSGQVLLWGGDPQQVRKLTIPRPNPAPAHWPGRGSFSTNISLPAVQACQDLGNSPGQSRVQFSQEGAMGWGKCQNLPSMPWEACLVHVRYPRGHLYPISQGGTT